MKKCHDRIGRWSNEFWLRDGPGSQNGWIRDIYCSDVVRVEGNPSTVATMGQSTCTFFGWGSHYAFLFFSSTGWSWLAAMLSRSWLPVRLLQIFRKMKQFLNEYDQHLTPIPIRFCSFVNRSGTPSLKKFVFVGRSLLTIYLADLQQVYFMGVTICNMYICQIIQSFKQQDTTSHTSQLGCV